MFQFSEFSLETGISVVVKAVPHSSEVEGHKLRLAVIMTLFISVLLWFIYGNNKGREVQIERIEGLKRKRMT